jgi:hypothetical protein
MRLADIKDPVKREAYRNRRKRENTLQDRPMAPLAPAWLSKKWEMAK